MIIAMNTYFPITSALNQEATSIHTALDKRALALKNKVDGQNVIKRICLAAFKMLSLATCLIAIASIPVAVVTLTAAPLTIAAAGFAISISLLALSIILDPRSAGETIIKDQWKALFSALRQGSGTEIVNTSQALAKQKRHRAAAYQKCVGELPMESLTSFFHKTRLIGHLLSSIEHLAQSNIPLTRQSAQSALTDFEQSGFSHPVKLFIQTLIERPIEIYDLNASLTATPGIHKLDYMIFLRNKS